MDDESKLELSETKKWVRRKIQEVSFRRACRFFRKMKALDRYQMNPHLSTMMQIHEV